MRLDESFGFAGLFFIGSLLDKVLFWLATLTPNIIPAARLPTICVNE
tara:strand:+ start:39 stop:179 length:141 start_codon:yes stop_codon:yes gene_type:complete